MFSDVPHAVVLKWALTAGLLAVGLLWKLGTEL